MIRLAAVIDRFEADFRAQYRHRLTSDHYRALAAMKLCRTPGSPMMQVQCTQCAQRTRVPHSCGHRHWPHCQHHESQQWLERQLQKQVPAEYFLRPSPCPPNSGRSPGRIRASSMSCSWDTVRTFSRNDKQLRGTPGAIAVLHTYTRRLDDHPHVHLVMPAAAADAERRQRRTKRCQTKGGYLFHHKAPAKVFRAKLLAGIEAAGLALPRRHPATWVVDCKSVGSGRTALIYLGRYLYRGVIAEKDIVACQDGQVSFRYRNAKTGKMERRTVSGAQFLWLVLQHMLPKGFRRARNFGFLHPNGKRLIDLLHLLLKFAPARAVAWVKERAPILCRCCGAVMVIVSTRIRSGLSGGMVVPIVAEGAH